MNIRKKYIFVALLTLAIIGLADSIVVHEKISGVFYAPCVVGNGCDFVLYSSYSNFFGVPLSWVGIVFYSILALFIIFLIIKRTRILENIVFLMITAGFIFSLYLLYIQIFKVGSLCTYCMISFSDMVLAMAIALYFGRMRGKSLQG